jgi:hypothetical protein
MIDRTGSNIRARRQERVAKVVWGTLFVVMGVLFTLHDMGRINLGEPRNGLVPEHAVDGDDKTRWGSSFRDKQWLMVDLGALRSLEQGPPELGIRVREGLRAADLQRRPPLEHGAPGDGGDGGVEEQEIGQTARYVRVLGLRRATPYGISLYELQVFDSDGQLISQGKRATASSVEDQVAFALCSSSGRSFSWPAGCPSCSPRGTTRTRCSDWSSPRWVLPRATEPRDGALGSRQTSAVVLILVGVVILLQSQRRSEESGTGSSGDSL